ncbi:hypothetical protein [Clostridium senegalense]
MFKEFKKEIRKGKLLVITKLLLNECLALADDFEKNRNEINYNNCIELKKIANDLFKYCKNNE